MIALLVFALVLLLAALVSDFVQRSVLSVAVLFLIAGAAARAVGLLHPEPGHPLLQELLEVMLFAILFTDGMRVDLPHLRHSWRLPARALGIGLPLTFALTALFSHLLLTLPWRPSLLLGAVLAPTDPAFAAAIVGRDDVPLRLRRFLNLESGLNDGIALPLVLALLASAHGAPVELHLLLQVAAGVGLGVATVWAGITLVNLPIFGATHAYQRYLVLALGLLVFSLSRLTTANEFLAAFAAGTILVSLSEPFAAAFRAFGESIADLLKFAGILLFGAVLSIHFLAALPGSVYLFVALVLLVARPLPVSLCLVGTGFSWRQRAVAAWFGPKGFSSVLYALFILRARIPGAEFLFDVAAAVIATSMLAHSSTDLLAARWLKRHEDASQAPETATPVP